MSVLSAASLWGTLLVLMRLVPIGVLLALLTRGLVPLSVSLAWMVALAVGLAPLVVVPDGGLTIGLIALIGSRELCIGLAFALACCAPLLALFWSARVGEHAVWANSSVPMARLYVWAAALLVLSLGGHRALLSALSQSLVDLPLGASVPRRDGLLAAVLTIVRDALVAALALGLPLWLALWLLDVTYALVERLRSDAPAVQRAPLRMLVAQLLLVLLLGPLSSRIPGHFREGVARARSALQRLVR